MKTIAEINQQNEEFINKIIGESAFNNGDEHIDVEDIENTCDIPDSDPADPTVCELVVTLACGETLKMAFTSQVMDSLLGQSKEIKDMVNQLHEMCAYIYADEQLDTIENIIKDIMSNEDLAIPNPFLSKNFKKLSLTLFSENIIKTIIALKIIETIF